MPSLGYRNRLIPGEDLNQGQIITPPNKEFPVPDYKAQMAFTQAMGKVSEVLLTVEQNRKWATLQTLKTTASDDAAADLQEIKLLTDSDQIEPIAAQKRTDREKGYREMATKAGMDYDSEVYPKIETVFRKRELNEKAFKAELIHKDTSNMMFGQEERYKRAMIQTDLTSEGEQDFRNYSEGRKSTIDAMVDQRIISRQVGDAMIAQTETIKQQRLEGYIKKIENADMPEKALEVLENGTMTRLGMNPVSVENAIRQSQTMVRVKRAEEVRIAEHNERKAEKAVKDAQEAKANELYILEGQGKLTIGVVENALRTRAIPDTEGRQLLRNLRGAEKGTDNPIIVGDIGEKLEAGLDVRDDLERALETGDIKDTTYITLRKSAGDARFKRGMSFIKTVVKPNPLDKTDYEMNHRAAEAEAEYSRRFGEGEEDEMEIARDIAFKFTSEKKSSFRSLPSPKYLEGDRSDLGMLNKSRIKTLESFKNGTMQPDEYRKEIRLIDELVRQLRAQQAAEKAYEESNMSDAERAKKLKAQGMR